MYSFGHITLHSTWRISIRCLYDDAVLLGGHSASAPVEERWEVDKHEQEVSMMLVSTT